MIFVSWRLSRTTLWVISSLTPRERPRAFSQTVEGQRDSTSCRQRKYKETVKAQDSCTPQGYPWQGSPFCNCFLLEVLLFVSLLQLAIYELPNFNGFSVSVCVSVCFQCINIISAYLTLLFLHIWLQIFRIYKLGNLYILMLIRCCHGTSSQNSYIHTFQLLSPAISTCAFERVQSKSGGGRHWHE